MNKRRTQGIIPYPPFRWIPWAWIFFLCCASGVFAIDHPELKAFPAPGTGTNRFVIVLPSRDRAEEETLKVELVAGKTMMTDGVNVVRLGVTIEPHPLQGWGYTYYDVAGKDVVMSTMMAVPEGHPQEEAFVAGEPLLIRYNSRLPIVVYAPEGMEIRYRIWEAPSTTETAKQG